jgi:hypothetical protein
VASNTETDDSTCSSTIETLRFDRIYVTDLLSLHRVVELFHEPTMDILRVECHPSLPYFVIGDSQGRVQLWNMINGRFDQWTMIYDYSMDGAILSTYWIPFECEVRSSSVFFSSCLLSISTMSEWDVMDVPRVSFRKWGSLSSLYYGY